MRVKVRFLLPKVFGLGSDSYIVDVDDSYSILELIKRLGIELGSEVILKSVSNGGEGLLVMVNDAVVDDFSRPLRYFTGCGSYLDVIVAPLLEGG